MAKKKKSVSTFLVCVNEKDHSRTALRFACSKAKKTGNVVKMLYVIDPIDYNTIFSVADVIKQERIEQAEEFMRGLQDDSKNWCDRHPAYTIKEGLMDDEIVNLIEEDSSINLLVLGAAPDGSSAKSGLMAELSSSIGSKIPVPLLIVPGNLTDQQIDELT